MILAHMLIPSSLTGLFTTTGTYWLFFWFPTQAIFMHLTLIIQETIQQPLEPIGYYANIQLRLKSHNIHVIPHFSRHMHNYLSINL